MDKPEEVDYTQIAFHLNKPKHPYIVMLAEQLERMADGVPTAVVYSYSTELPNLFDPANPPPGILPNSRHAMLVDAFYRNTTCRDCTVNNTDNTTAEKTRCPSSAVGFRQIMHHQQVKHQRRCHYFCLVEDCLAPFDKVGNAKRHVTALHTSEAVLKRRREERRRKHDMDRRLAAARKKGELRKETKGKVKKRSPRRNPKARVHQKVSPPIAPTGRSFKTRLRMKPSVLDLKSRVSTDVESGHVELTVRPTDFTTADIEMFHTEKMPTGTLDGEVDTTEQKEWVAVAGLLDIYYWPANVQYTFKKRR